MVTNSPVSAKGKGDASSILSSGRSPGVGNGNRLQYSCLENPTDRGAWPATVHGVSKSWGRLSNKACTRLASSFIAKISEKWGAGRHTSVDKSVLAWWTHTLVAREINGKWLNYSWWWHCSKQLRLQEEMWEWKYPKNITVMGISNETQPAKSITVKKKTGQRPPSSQSWKRKL